MQRLVFWGTGDAMGVPRVYCDCAVCQEARTGGINRRLRCSVWLEGGDGCGASVRRATESEAEEVLEHNTKDAVGREGGVWRDTAGEGEAEDGSVARDKARRVVGSVVGGDGSMLLDCGPDFGRQMEAAGVREVRRVLITHAHFDHIGGLPEWYDALRWQGVDGELWAPVEVLSTIRRQFPWIEKRILFTACDDGFDHAGWRIRPWKVCHGYNGFAYAYRFERGDFRWAYCSDSINLQGAEREPLYGLDLLVLGTSFYREEAPFHTRSVYDMVEALELLNEVSPKQVLFTHMSHEVDLRKSYPLPTHVRLAQAGMTVELGGEA